MHHKIQVAIIDLRFLMSLLAAAGLSALHYVFVSTRLDA